MRGNFDTAEPLVHAPNQQRQQQQQTIVEEQSHPLQSPTTPAWGIADRIVKEEPIEDKNNDSGVSPDHYTSNSSTANCSLSPGSANSQDSNTMHCSTIDYSPQRMFKNCGSPPEFARHHRSMDDHQSDQVMDVVSSTMKPSTEDEELGQDILQCPICAFATPNRLKFSEHLTTHCPTKCDASDFTKNVFSQLTGSGPQQEDRSSPTQGERSEQESEETDEPGLRVPRVNSQGKVKTFRCKQCNFVAITKLEFWEHSRGHIRAEKLLTCPKCPFVTEYKHHLEYHLRNHFGSKPFKCDKCTYSCVNKSMLNSHLKSHSNIYQYRCANCSYATKYCHSLKLHLRKYSHQPAMVLNADGSPNPLPIIDIYGTRRGPKQKPIKQQDEVGQNGNMATNNNLQSPLSSPQLVVPSEMSPVSHRLPINSLNGMNGINGMNGMNGMNCINGIKTTVNSIGGVNAANPIGGLNGVVQNQPMMAFPYHQFFAGFPLAHFPGSEDCSVEKQLERLKSTALMDYAKSIDGDRIVEELPQDLAIKCFGGNKNSNGYPNGLAGNEPAKANEMLCSPSLPTRDRDPEEAKATPLDLSKPDTIGHVQSKPTRNSPRATGTSRRKGRAVKLDRRVVEDDTDEEQQQQQQQLLRSPQQSEQTQQTQQGELTDTFEPPIASSPPESTDAKDNGDCTLGLSNEFTCQFCEIAFGNVVMYTVHMGYHGYKDPYTCNMCGLKCTDKVSFFLHIARSKHT